MCGSALADCGEQACKMCKGNMSCNNPKHVQFRKVKIKPMFKHDCPGCKPTSKKSAPKSTPKNTIASFTHAVPTPFIPSVQRTDNVMSCPDKRVRVNQEKHQPCKLLAHAHFRTSPDILVFKHKCNGKLRNVAM